MATTDYVENLKARRLVVSQRLADLDADQAAGSKPNTKIADGGTTIDHVQFRLSLYKELEMLDKLILDAEMAGDGAGGIEGCEVISYADP